MSTQKRKAIVERAAQVRSPHARRRPCLAPLPFTDRFPSHVPPPGHSQLNVKLTNGNARLRSQEQ